MRFEPVWEKSALGLYGSSELLPFVFRFLTGRQLTAPWVRQKFLTSYNPPPRPSAAHGTSLSSGPGGDNAEPPVADIENVQASSCSSGGCTAREAVRRREALESNEESEPGLYSPSLCAWYENFDRYFAPQFFPAGRSSRPQYPCMPAIHSSSSSSLYVGISVIYPVLDHHSGKLAAHCRRPPPRVVYEVGHAAWMVITVAFSDSPGFSVSSSTPLIFTWQGPSYERRVFQGNLGLCPY